MSSENSIIIVDDSPFIRKQLTYILKKNHLTISASLANGMAALASCRKLCPEIIIVDLDMPEMNGILTIKQILDDHDNINIIAMSSLGKPQLIKQALLAGAKDYIVKPLKESQVLITLKRLSSSSQAQKSESAKLSYHKVF